MRDLLMDAAHRAVRYAESVGRRRVAPSAEEIARLTALDGPLPDHPSDPESCLALLDDVGSPATVASAGPRYFGFVTGGALPAALAANWLASAWDQNVAIRAMSPVAAALEDVAIRWLLDVLHLPRDCGVGFVTGATMANFTCLAAARHAVLARAGWSVEEEGLLGAPPVTIVVGAEAHVSLLKALSLVGFGTARLLRVRTDSQGRMTSSGLPPVDERTIICIQAGNVNTGAFDPAGDICARAVDAGAWVHVDGAFGLWAAAAPPRAHLMAGFEKADSWATDCHKWLNVPYDSGLAFVRNAEHLRAAMTLNAAYLHTTADREPFHYTPEASRRARAIEVWAALRSLGRQGLAELIERNCRLASRFASQLREAGFHILNDVDLNQVLVSFGEADETKRVIAAVQADGTCWCGGTEWHGQAAMRISVSNWSTTEQDVDRSVAAITRVARSARHKSA
jgi:glutamate/tyrosine decarboxylase-like PLP-dependent enzyme